MSEQPQNGSQDSDNDATRTDAGTSTDAQAAADLGTTEGEVRQAVRESGAQHAAGHEGTRPVWEHSPGGKEYLEGEDKRQEQIEKENREAEEARENSDTPEDKSVLDAKLDELGDDDNKDDSDEE